MNFSDYSKFTVECTTKYTPEFIEYVVDLCYDYGLHGKEKSENYTPDRLRANFKQGRFEYGFFIVKHDGNVVATFGADRLDKWVVLSRYLRHTKSNILEPLLCGVCFPFVLDHLKDQIEGICWTQNMDKRDLVGVGLRRFAKAQKQEQLHEVAAVYINKIQKIPGTVMHRGVEQYAFFIPTSGTVPPFKQLHP